MRAQTKVLLVEDNPADADLISEAFEQERVDINLSVVIDGQEAMDYLLGENKYQQPQRPDLILLDLNLPRKDGRELLAELKEHPKLKVIPVIILTTSESEEDIIATYKLHANGYVTKPRDFAEYGRVAQGIDKFWFDLARLPHLKNGNGPLLA